MVTRSFRAFSIVLLIPILVACSLFTSRPAPSQADIDKEEQAVYSLFVHAGKGPALILENTATDISHEDPQQTVDYLKSSMEELSRETLNSFIERNETPSSLSADMDLRVEYVLLNERELAEITRQPNWPEVMAEKYSGSVGYTVFSHVGFNRSLDQAVLYVGDVAGPLMGAGFYYLLEKQNGEWKIIQEIMAWIS